MKLKELKSKMRNRFLITVSAGVLAFSLVISGVTCTVYAAKNEDTQSTENEAEEAEDDSIDIAVIKKILSDLVKTENEFIPTPSLIIEETGKYFSVTADDIRSKRKTHTISIARQVSVYLIRKLTNVTLENIGSEFSGRDHSTVLSSIKKVETLMKTDKDLSKAIKDITSNIGSRK